MKLYYENERQLDSLRVYKQYYGVNYETCKRLRNGYAHYILVFFLTIFRVPVVVVRPRQKILFGLLKRFKTVSFLEDGLNWLYQDCSDVPEGRWIGWRRGFYDRPPEVRSSISILLSKQTVLSRSPQFKRKGLSSSGVRVLMITNAKDPTTQLTSACRFLQGHGIAVQDVALYIAKHPRIEDQDLRQSIDLCFVKCKDCRIVDSAFSHSHLMEFDLIVGPRSALFFDLHVLACASSEGRIPNFFGLIN